MRHSGSVIVLLAFLAAPSHAQGQRLSCVSIRPGETAATVARRITGDARNRYEPWFHIVDSARSKLVDKTRYDYVRAGWSACVANGSAMTAFNPRVANVPRQVRAPSDAGTRSLGLLDSNVALWAALLIALALATWSVNQFLADRDRMLRVMRRFGEAFVREFEAPLVEPDRPERPLRSRLRARVHRRRLDILLAPTGARRYPNVSDHRRNLEYDVTRVLRRMPNPPLLCGSIYAHGGWVVIPFQFQVRTTQAGDM